MIVDQSLVRVQGPSQQQQQSRTSLINNNKRRDCVESISSDTTTELAYIMCSIATLSNTKRPEYSHWDGRVGFH
jgi:hypothetical protein